MIKPLFYRKKTFILVIKPLFQKPKPLKKTFIFKNQSWRPAINIMFCHFRIQLKDICELTQSIYIPKVLRDLSGISFLCVSKWNVPILNKKHEFWLLMHAFNEFQNVRSSQVCLGSLQSPIPKILTKLGVLCFSNWKVHISLKSTLSFSLFIN